MVVSVCILLLGMVSCLTCLVLVKLVLFLCVFKSVFVHSVQLSLSHSDAIGEPLSLDIVQSNNISIRLI